MTLWLRLVRHSILVRGLPILPIGPAVGPIGNQIGLTNETKKKWCDGNVLVSPDVPMCPDSVLNIHTHTHKKRQTNRSKKRMTRRISNGSINN